MSYRPLLITLCILWNLMFSHTLLANEPKAFVYTELQISIPFTDVPWQAVNANIKQQPGFLNKTWLAGAGNNSAGGFYAFASIADAQQFVSDYFPAEAKGLGVAQTTRIFDAEATRAASKAMNSPYFGGKLTTKPGAFVYTEVQTRVYPFADGPWRKINQKLKAQPGLLAKTWLSGISTATPGGLYAFDTLGNAKKFALEYFPAEAKAMNAAFYTRIFDASLTEVASRAMDSPFYQ